MKRTTRNHRGSGREGHRKEGGAHEGGGEAGHRGSLTAMYERVPTKELAIELMSWPLTPKSHNFLSPLALTRMLLGFTSAVTQ